MRKLSVKDLITFRSKSDKAKQNFANSIKVDKHEIPIEGGGDYWITCLSAISNGYRLNDVQPIIDKKNELEGKLEIAENKKTKDMYIRNIKILNDYESFDFTALIPTHDLSFLKKKKDNYVLTIKDIPIQVKPHYIFSFDNDGVQEVGSIWFIAKLNGFRIDELGMFTEILHKYLTTHFSEQYSINSKYCIAVDVYNSREVNYYQLENNEILKFLDSTLNSIKALM